MRTTQLLKNLMLLVAMVSMTSATCAKQNQAPQPVPQDQQQVDADAPDQVQVVTITSQKMGRDITNLVVVPEQYYDPDLQEEQYPVIYLLHGAQGKYSDWNDKADLEDIASNYSVIFVCPDGQDSWYFDSPIDPTMQFETYVSQELVQYIDTHYRTFDNRYMRAITGLSMGGHGALYLAWRHPDVFWSCGSMSGGVDITKYPEKWHIKDRLGPYQDNKQRWQEHSVCNLVNTLQASTLKPVQNIIIDDGADDFFLQPNIDLHNDLLAKKIPHDFTVRPGNHSWVYWVNALDYHVLFFSKAFERANDLMEQQQ